MEQSEEEKEKEKQLLIQKLIEDNRKMEEFLSKGEESHGSSDEDIDNSDGETKEDISVNGKF